MRISVVLLLLCMSQSSNAQNTASLYICIIGPMAGEKLIIAGDGEYTSIHGIKNALEMHGMFNSDSAKLRYHFEQQTFRHRGRFGLKYRKLDIRIPEGFDKYIVFRRDHSLKRKVAFTVQWSSSEPIEIQKLDERRSELDSVTQFLERPSFSIRLNGTTLDTMQLKRQGCFPGQFLPLEFRSEIPKSVLDSLSGTMVVIDRVIVLFAVRQAPIERIVYRGPLLMVGTRVPQHFKPEAGYKIIFGIRYSYKQDGKVIDSGNSFSEVAF